MYLNHWTAWPSQFILLLFQGERFEVPTDTLVFSVILYASCAILAILVLFIRRKLAVFGNGELGGPKGPKYASGLFLVFLWIFYVIMSSLQAYKVIEVNI